MEPVETGSIPVQHNSITVGEVLTLHEALALPDVNKSSIVRALIQNGADCDRRDETGLTACEVALTVQCDRELARDMTDAEFKRLPSVDRAFYVMIRRGSLTVFRLFLLVGKFDDRMVYEKVARSLIELNAKRVSVNGELEAFLFYRLAEYAFLNMSGDRTGGKDPNEWRNHFEVIAVHWNVLKTKYSDRDYAAIDNELVHRVQTIHNHLYFIKDKRFLRHLPMMETVFCLAMFVAICKWNERFQIFRLMIDKLKVMQFLNVICRQLTRVQSWLDLFGEKLTELMECFKSGEVPDKLQLMKCWERHNSAMNFGENIANKIINGFKRNLDHDIIASEIVSSENFDVLLKVNRRDRSILAKLRRCYFRTKQFYSFEKCISHMDAMPTDAAESISDQVAGADIKRLIQVIGEVIKTTKNSPNVSKRVADALECMLTDDFPTMNKYFREFFSHKYSLIKSCLYQQSIINSFSSIKRQLGQVKMIFSLLYVCSALEASRSILGTMHRCQSNEQLLTLLQYVGNLNTIKDTQMKHFELLKESMEKMSDDFSDIHIASDDRQAYLDRLKKGMKVKSTILEQLSECLICHWTFDFDDIRLSCQGNSDLSTIRRMIRWNLMNYGQSELHGVILSHWETDHDNISVSDAKNIGLQTHNPLAIGGILRNIVHRIRMIEEEECLANSRWILEDLVQTEAPTDLVEEFQKHLLKYYENIFCLDNKFRAIKHLFKTRKIPLNEERLKQMRFSDEEALQTIYDGRINDIRKILLFQDISSLESMVAKNHNISHRVLLALEYCLLELGEILISVGYFGDNFDLLKHRIPMIGGRNFRNYLAHDCLSYNVLTESGQLKVIANAMVIISNPIKLFQRSSTNTVEAISYPKDELVLQWVELQSLLADAVRKMNCELINQCLDRDGELSGKFCTSISSYDPLKLDAEWTDLIDNTISNEEFDRLLEKYNFKANSNFGKPMDGFFSTSFPRSLALLSECPPINVDTLNQTWFYWDDLVGKLSKDQLLSGKRDAKGRSLLHRFVLAGNIQGVLEIFKLQPDFDIDSVDDYGTTLLDIALHLGFQQITKLLLTKTPRISDANREIAIINHFNDILPQLFSDYARESTPNESFVKIATRANNSEALKFIVDNLYGDRQCNLRNQHLSSIISEAAYFNHTKVVALLLSLPNTDCFSEDSFSSGHLALHKSIRRRNWPVVKLLLDHGASPNWINPFRKHSTAFQFAVEANSLYILRSMKNINRELYRSLQHPMSIAIENDSAKMMRFLRKMGFSLLDSNRNLETAVRCDNVKYVNQIFEALDGLIDKWEKQEGLLGRIGQLMSRLSAMHYFEERESQSGTALLQAVKVKNWDLFSVLLDKSRKLRKFDGWYIDDIELMENQFYSNRRPIQSSGILCYCNRLLNRLNDCVNGIAQTRKITIDNQYSNKVFIDCYIITSDDIKNLILRTSQSKNICCTIFEITRAYLKNTNDLVFGCVNDTESAVLNYFIANREVGYIVRLTPSELSQPLKSLVNAGDATGESPLHMMVIRLGNPRMISLLLENGANPIAIKTLGQTPLHIALVAQEDYLSMLLLKYCVDHDLMAPDGRSAVEVRNGQGCRPIHFAAMFGKFAAVQFLLKQNVNVRELDNLGMHPACYAAAGGYTKILKLFLDYDPSLIDLVNSEGRTLLHSSTKREEEETVLTLLEYGASLLTVDNSGESPIQTAIGNANAAWVKTVLFFARTSGIRGLLDNIPDKRLPPMHYAVFTNKFELLKALVEYEIDDDLDAEYSKESLQALRNLLIRTMPEMGYTALHVAVQMNLKQSLEFLMHCQYIHNRQCKERINVAQDAVDLQGRTPLDYAMEAEDETVVNMVLNGE